jgi:hypothetical protein
MGTPLFPHSYLFGGDKRSYLYPGKNKDQLTPQERQLEAMYDRIDRPGHRVTPQEFFKSPDYAQFLDTQYGPIADKVPPGSQIISQNAFKVEYRDKDGYTHVLTRKPGSDGQVMENTDRPAIPVNKGQQQFTEQLQGKLQSRLNQPAQFAPLPPDVQAQLDAISAAERGDIQKQATDARGQIVAQLYGNNVNKSSIADDQSARFLEVLGRLNQQQASGAAQRGIGLQQYLTDLIQRQGEGEASLYANLTGQGTQRDISGAGLGLEKLKLDETGRQFDASNEISKLLAQLERDKFNQSKDAISQISRLIGIGQQGAAAASGGLSAYRALTGGR